MVTHYIDRNPDTDRVYEEIVRAKTHEMTEEEIIEKLDQMEFVWNLKEGMGGNSQFYRI